MHNSYTLGDLGTIDKPHQKRCLCNSQINQISQSSHHRTSGFGRLQLYATSKMTLSEVPLPGEKQLLIPAESGSIDAAVPLPWSQSR